MRHKGKATRTPFLGRSFNVIILIYIILILISIIIIIISSSILIIIILIIIITIYIILILILIIRKLRLVREGREGVEEEPIRKLPLPEIFYNPNRFS